MIVLYKNREVELGRVFGRHHDDLELESAFWVDTNEELDDEDFEYVCDFFAEEIYEMWYDRNVMEAEYAYDHD